MNSSFSADSVGKTPQNSHTPHPLSHAQSVSAQFAGMMKQKQELSDKDHEEVVEDLENSPETNESTDLKKVHAGRHKSSLDDEPSLPKTIHHIQQRLTRLSKIKGQEHRAEQLQDIAQESINKLQDQGYKVNDVTLPEADQTL